MSFNTVRNASQPQGRMPPVWAVIVNWNGAKDTVECIESLRFQEDVRLDIVVVDNKSTDATDIRLIKEHTGAHVHLIVNDQNAGFSGGNNIGIRYAMDHGADYVLIINNDTIVDDKYLVAKLVGAVRNDPRIGLASPSIFYYPATEQVWYAGTTLNLWLGWKHLRRVPVSTTPIDTGYASGCCMLVPLDFIRQVGMLPEPYFLGVEDIEWSLRAKKSGWRVVYVPGATLLHKDSMSSRAETGGGTYSPTRIYFEHRNTIWLIRQYGNVPQRWIVWPLILSLRFSYKLAAYIALRRWAKVWALLRAIHDGMLTKPVIAV